MFFINNPNLRKFETFMKENTQSPPKGMKVDLDKLEDEILLFEVEKIIVSFKQHKGKKRIMKFRKDRHRSTFLKGTKKQSFILIPTLTVDKIYCQNPSALPKEPPAAVGMYVQYNTQGSYAPLHCRYCGSAFKKWFVYFLNGF